MDRQASTRLFLGGPQPADISTAGGEGTAPATQERRDFLKQSAILAASALGAPLLPALLRGASEDPSSPGSHESVCLKSSPPAHTLWAVRIEGLKDRLAERLPLSCLQGLVNRRRPQIFLAYDHFDQQWLDWLRERGDVREVRWVQPKELYERFLPAAQGLVVTDPKLPGSVNVATMLAAVEGWLPVTPSLCKELRRRCPGFASLKVAMDLRGRWKKNVAAYQWFYENYGSRMSRRMCANYDPGQFELRDYLVEFKVPLVWVSHPDDCKRDPAASWADESQFARDLFQKLPANIPCLGWWDRGQGGEEGCGENGPFSGMELASQYAKFELCTAFDGFARGVGNLSVHSGTSATFRQKSAPPLPPLADKVYYTYTRTDGDGMNFWRQVYRDLWDQPAHGKVPVAWQLGPTGFDLIPDILDYFYKHATANDVFVNALTGIGYIRESVYLEKLPKAEQQPAWNQYMDLSARYFRRLDLSLLTTFEAFQLMPQERLERLAALPGLKAIYRNYSRFPSTTADNAASEVNGVPVFRAVIDGPPVANIVRQFKQFAGAKRPAFLHASLSNWFVDMRVLVEVEKALGPDYVAVRPDQLPALYLQAKKRR